MLAIMMKIFNVTRLLLKHTNLMMLALMLFFAGLSYSYYRASRAHAEQINVVQSVNRELIAQLASEREATLALQKRQAALYQTITARNKRFTQKLQQPAVSESASQSLAPALKHALNELRKIERGEE